MRSNLINDTMMPHPIHLHGHFFELVNGQARQPLKHTVNVAPGSKAAFGGRSMSMASQQSRLVTSLQEQTRDLAIQAQQMVM